MLPAKGESDEIWFKCIVVESGKWQLNDENRIENLVIATDFNACMDVVSQKISALNSDNLFSVIIFVV